MNYQKPCNILNLAKDIGINNNIWIYNWEETPKNEKIFAIDCQTRNIISIKLPQPYFTYKYNHVIIVTRHINIFKSRIQNLSNTHNIFSDLQIEICHKDTGHIINRNFSPQEIYTKKNIGHVIRIYCKEAKLLNKLLKTYSDYYVIDAMGDYKNVIQCFFNIYRYNSFKKNKNMADIFSSRGLYRVAKNPVLIGGRKNICGGPECYLEYISDYNKKYSIMRVSTFQIERKNNIISSCILRNGLYEKDLLLLRGENEKKLIQDILNTLYCTEKSGIVIVGWNVNRYDYKYLLERAAFHGMLNNNLHQNDQNIIPMPPWKLCIDALIYKNILQNIIIKFPTYNPPSNNLKDVCKALDIDDQNSNENTLLLLQFLKKTNMVECVLEFLHIADKSCNTVCCNDNMQHHSSKFLKFSRIFSPSISSVSIACLQNFFQSIVIAPLNVNSYLYTGRKKRQKYVNDTKYKDEIIEKEEFINNIPGGLVLEPIKGVHYGKNIGSVDFNSLYPNIMLTFGIMKGYVSYVSEKEYYENKSFYDTNFVVAPWQNILGGQKKLYYLSSTLAHKHEIPIQIFCKYLIFKRNQYKNNSPGQSLSFKLLINSIFGLYANQHSCIYCPISATMITKYGRYILQEAVEYFTTQFPQTACLYGDTDSVFLSSVECIDKMVSEYNIIDFYPFIKLKVESIFEWLILIRKKLYMGKLKTSLSSRYKISGFPFHLPGPIYDTMIKCLHFIIDYYNIDINIFVNNTIDFLREQFQNYLSEALIDKSNHIIYIKKTMLEEYRGNEEFGNDEEYIPIFILIPQKKNERSSSSKYICPISRYDSKIDKIDEKAIILYYLAPTFNSLFEVLSLPRLEFYFQSKKERFIKEYIDKDYVILDFSNKYYDDNKLFINSIEILSNNISEQVKNIWRKNVNNDKCLLLYSTLNINNCPMVNDKTYYGNKENKNNDITPQYFFFLTLDDTRDCPKFTSLFDLQQALKCVLGKSNEMKIKLIINYHNNNIQQHCHQELLPFLSFIYNKLLNWNEIGKYWHDKDCIKKNFLYIIQSSPPIAIIKHYGGEEKILYIQDDNNI